MSTLLDRSQPPLPGELRHFTFPPIERVVLSNGLPLWYARTEGLPVATVTLLLASGAARERASHAGVATLTGSLLESGAAEMDAHEISERLERIGVRLQVGTAWEVSRVDFNALSTRIGPALDLLGRLIQEPTFPEAEVERVRNQHVAGIVQRRAEPRGFANELISRYLFSEDSLYSRPLGGSSTTVGSLTRVDVQEYHTACFTPAGSAVVVAGNIALDDVRAQAERALGSWKGDALSALDFPVKPRTSGVQVVVIDRPGAVQSEIRIGHMGVPRNTPDYFPITVLNTILGGAFSSRLNLNLREKHGFTYGVRSSFAMRRGPGPFLISTAVQTEVTGAAIREILSEVNRLREEKVGIEELRDARQYVAGTFPLPLQTTGGVAARLAELFVHDLPDGYLDEYGERILAVTEDDVLQAAQAYLQPDEATILVLGDASSVREQLEGTGLSEIDVVSQDTIS